MVTTPQPAPTPPGVPATPPGAPTVPPPGVVQVASANQGASFNPDDQLQGSALPVQQNLTIRQARFAYWDYDGKYQQALFARVDYVADDGNQYIQYYSVGPTDRWMPVNDGKEAKPIGTNKGFNDNCNYILFINKVISCGFPQNRVGSDISILDGLYAYYDGMEGPKRTGKGFEGRGNQVNVILVPMEIHRYPWEVQTAAPSPLQPTLLPPVGPPQATPPPSAPATPPITPAAPPAPSAAPSPPAPVTSPQNVNDAGTDMDIPAIVLGLTNQVSNITNGNFTLQQVMSQALQDYGSDPNRDVLISHLFTPDFALVLQTQGYQLTGHQVTRV